MAEGVAVVELFLRDVAQFASNVQMTLNFKRGAVGHCEKAHKVLAAGASEALGDVRHDRHARAANLVAQAEVSREGFLLRHLIYGDRQLLRFLPSLDIFESLNLHAKNVHHKHLSHQPDTRNQITRNKERSECS
jgi:hypothetical protein